MRASRAMVVYLLGALAGPAGAQAPAAATDPPVSRPDPLAAAMEAWADQAAAFADGPDQYGMFLSATQMRAAGRVLVVHARDGAAAASTSCSGVLVGPRHVLTAAHCVCGPSFEAWHSDDAAACAPVLDKLRVAAFFPTAGLFDAAGPPVVHPAYRSPNLPIAAGETRLADLAVVELAEAPPRLRPVPLGRADAAGRALTASFGRLRFSWFPPGAGLAGDALYQDGVQQMARHKGLATDPAECGIGAGSDTVCTSYAASTRRRGTELDAAACGGDSGAPLLRVPPDGGEPVLVGITSYHHPSVRDCRSARDTHFIDVSRYADWVRATAGGAGARPPLAPAGCAEAVFGGPLRAALRAGPGVVSATAFDEVSGDGARPEVLLGVAPGVNCRWAPAFGVVSCVLPEAGQVGLSLGSGFAQVTVCGSG